MPHLACDEPRQSPERQRLQRFVAEPVAGGERGQAGSGKVSRLGCGCGSCNGCGSGCGPRSGSGFARINARPRSGFNRGGFTCLRGLRGNWPVDTATAYSRRGRHAGSRRQSRARRGVVLQPRGSRRQPMPPSQRTRVHRAQDTPGVVPRSCESIGDRKEAVGLKRVNREHTSSSTTRAPIRRGSSSKTL